MLQNLNGMMVLLTNGNKEDKIMKNIFRISALMCAMVFLTTSCVKDELFDEPQQKPAAVGDEIIFGSRAGFENSDKTTRTVYSGETYEVGDATFERIDWEDGEDRVQIYCPEASNVNVADYFVYDNSNENDQDGTDEDGKSVATKDKGYLVKVGDSALQWSSDDTHTFYAMYPATSQVVKNGITNAQGVQMNKKTLQGVVPLYQLTKGEIEDTLINGKITYIAHPNMDIAYMAAKATATRANGAVSLDFVPIVTAVEIELVANQVTKIKELRLTGKGIAGGFVADLENWDPTTSTYPTCTNKETYEYTFISDEGKSTTETLSESDIITYSLPEMVTLNTEEKLKFTVFLRPGADYSNLSIGFSENRIDYMTSTIESDYNTEFSCPAHMKTKISGINLPKPEVKIEWDSSNWMTALPDDTELAYLSLPGTGGSFSYAYNGDDPQYYRQQDTDFDLDAQWKAGIRAFELVVDRHSSTGTSLGSAPLKCNKTAVTTTDGETTTTIKFGDAMDQLMKKVHVNNNECAVVILTYQPEGASPARNAESFIKNLNAWWTAIGTQTLEGVEGGKNKQLYFEKYSPTAMLRSGDNPVAGKILLIVRPNQKYENEGSWWDRIAWNTVFNTAKETLNSDKILLVDGCGTAKDRWGARGYLIENTSNNTVIAAPDISNNEDDNDYIEYYMTNDFIFQNGDTHTSGDYTITRPAIGSEGNFGFETNDNGVTCWYQEWARVVGQNYNNAYSTGYGSGNIYWFESLKEKMSNIEQTFIKAVNTNPVTDKTIYINSLCGYLQTADFNESWYPSVGNLYGGAGGDIKKLAKEVEINDEDLGQFEGLNAWFEAMVNDSQLDQTTGPTGIIMMDYVEPTDEILGTIISNNFKFSK